MSRRRDNQNAAEAPGQDSFLDVVANLVGILIILVVVVGAGTRSAAVALARQTQGDEQPATAAVDNDLQEAERALTAVQQSHRELEARIAREQAALTARERERNETQIIVSVAEQRLKEHRDQLSAAEQERYDLAQELTAAQQKLQELEQAKRVAGEAPPPAVLEHYPTPMAKTVFGQELHFRLAAGRIAFVPWDELVARLKADAPNKVQRLRDQPRIEETLPPLGGYLLKYALRRTDAVMQARSGAPSAQTRIELERFVVIPILPNLGEPLTQALQPNSEFQARLAEHDPRKTTLTVWTYPDSFEDFRKLKGEMFKRGYLTAARPLPDGLPIGGSPDGSRSVAE